MANETWLGDIIISFVGHRQAHVIIVQAIISSFVGIISSFVGIISSFVISSFVGHRQARVIIVLAIISSFVGIISSFVHHKLARVIHYAVSSIIKLAHVIHYGILSMDHPLNLFFHFNLFIPCNLLIDPSELTIILVASKTWLGAIISSFVEHRQARVIIVHHPLNLFSPFNLFIPCNLLIDPSELTIILVVNETFLGAFISSFVEHRQAHVIIVQAIISSFVGIINSFVGIISRFFHRIQAHVIHYEMLSIDHPLNLFFPCNLLIDPSEVAFLVANGTWLEAIIRSFVGHRLAKVPLPQL